MMISGVVAGLTLLEWRSGLVMCWNEISCHFATSGLNHLAAVAGAGLLLPVYFWAYAHQFYDMSSLGWLAYPLACLVFDFLYYWFHRLSHSITPLWWVHSVHHQATFLTPALAMRASAFDFTVAWILLVPVLLLGFAREHLLAALAVHAVYQVFLHLRWKISLGWLEWLFNTPAHHTLHHATNRPYLDKNFASVLIVWDRMFGSFVALDKKEEPRIDVLGRNDATNPLLTNLVPIFESFAISLPKQPGFWLVNLAVFAFAMLAMALGWQSSVWPIVVVVVGLLLLAGLHKVRNLRFIRPSGQK